MRILAIESSAVTASVAILEDDTLVADIFNGSVKA